MDCWIQPFLSATVTEIRTLGCPGILTTGSYPPSTGINIPNIIKYWLFFSKPGWTGALKTVYIYKNSVCIYIYTYHIHIVGKFWVSTSFGQEPAGNDVRNKLGNSVCTVAYALHIFASSCLTPGPLKSVFFDGLISKRPAGPWHVARWHRVGPQRRGRQGHGERGLVPGSTPAWDLRPVFFGHRSCPWKVSLVWPCYYTSCNDFFRWCFGWWLVVDCCCTHPACCVAPLKSCQGSASECGESLAGKTCDPNTKKPDDLPSRTTSGVAGGQNFQISCATESSFRAWCKIHNREGMQTVCWCNATNPDETSHYASSIVGDIS